VSVATEPLGDQAPARIDRDAPKSRRRRLTRALTYVVASLLALWVLVPIYLITMVTFIPREDVRGFPKRLVPETFSSDTFQFFVNSAGVTDALVNSVVVALMTMAMSLTLGAPAGYALARFVFRGADAYRLLVLSTRAFPIVILSIPLAVTFLRWGIVDTSFSVALMHTALALPFVVLITASIFVSVPRDLEEVAETLGCTRVQAFLRVTLPLSLPGIFAGTLLTFIPAAGDFINAELLGSAGQLMIGNVIQSKFLAITDYGQAAALSMIVIAAVLLVIAAYTRVVGTEKLTG
jgi:multiple sugar transport system permease protein